MKTIISYQFILVLFLAPMFLFANHERDWNGKHSEEKIIKREFSVLANATLKVDNSYGNINVTTYEGTVIAIEVHIKTNGNDEDKVRQKLRDIDVEFTASSAYVSAKTLFSKSKSNSWWNWGRDNNVNMEINYIIKLPISNNVDLNNDYGSISLDRLEGRANLNCDYGKITTKELMADNNNISFDYSNSCYFEYIKSGKINADYSSYTVAKTKNLAITADYTKSEVEIAENVTYNCDYGSVNINNANNVNGNGDYLTVRLGNIYKNVSLRADYGSIKIDNMTANAGNIDIESDYNGITIGYDEAYDFSFDIDLEYASLRNAEEFQFTKKRVESTDKYYQGYYRNANSSNRIRIQSDYGSVTFKKN